MARRRRLAGVGQAIQDSSSQLINFILQQRLAAMADARRAEMQKQQTQQQYDLQSRNQLLQNAQGDPQQARRLARSGAEVPEGFLPTQEEIAGPLYEQLGKATTPAQLPNEGSVMGQFAAGGGDTSVVPGLAFGRHPFTGRQPVAQDLLDTRAGRQVQLGREQTRAEGFEKIEEKRPDGSMVVRYVPKSDLGSMQPVTTGLPQAVQDSLDRASKQNVDLHPDIIRAEAQKAGQISGAQTEARLNVEFSPQHTERFLARARQQAEQEALIKRDEAKLIAVREASDAAMIALRPLRQMRAIYDKIALDRGVEGAIRGTGRAIGQRTGALGQINPLAAQLDQMREGYASFFFDAMQGKGVMSDQDRAGVMQLLPSSATNKDVAEDMWNNVEIMLGMAPIIKSKLFDMPFLQQLATAQRWTQLMQQAPPEADTIFDPETGVELPNVRKR